MLSPRLGEPGFCVFQTSERRLHRIAGRALVVPRWAAQLDVQRIRREVNLAQEGDQAADQREHGADEQSPGEPFEVDEEELLDEQGHDDDADQERRVRAEIDRPGREMTPAGEDSKFNEAGRSSRLAITASSAPIPVSRNTGATAS